MIVRKDQSFPKRPVTICIYGTPGVGKTSLANTAEDALLVDCDRGADRACNRTDTIIASKWQDVIDDEAEFKHHKTAIFDTAKSILDDYLMLHVVTTDYKLAKNQLKAYGEVGKLFKMFINARRSEDVDLIIIAHAKEEKDGDVIKFSPDITGQSKDLILRNSDQVGFMTVENNKRIITFDPTDKTIGKNVARLPKMEVPEENDPKYKTFMADIIALVKDSISKQSAEQIEAQKLISDFTDEILRCETSDNLMSVSENCKSLPRHLQEGMRKLILERVGELGLKYDKASNSFIVK